MNIISQPTPINLSAFSSESKSLEVKYGLPTNVQYCKKCVITNQRPNSAVEYDHVANSTKKTIFDHAEFLFYRI